jgi:opacity protein-like surface antigen
MRRLILIICFSLPGFFALSQTWEVGISAGASGYMGDISPVKPYTFTDPAFGAQFKRNFSGHWSAKVGFMQGRIQGDDAKSSNTYQIDRNLHFRSRISELSLQVEFNLFNYLPGGLPGFGSRRFSPYIFTGVGAVAFNPVADYNGSEIELRPLQTEAIEYKKIAISIPYGAGVKYNLKGNWNIIGEIGYRTARTDYLDDLSGRYPDFTLNPPASPISPDLSDRSISQNGLPGVQRGDFRPRDTYMFTAISLTYTFVSVKCPTF